MFKIAVLGDLIKDIFLFGSQNRINPEGPYPLINYESRVEKLGGAGNLLSNLRNLELDAVSFFDHDNLSEKTRIVVDGRIIFRLDDDKIIKNNTYLTTDFSEFQYVVLSDYNKGAITDAPSIINHLNKFKCKVIIDPKKPLTEYAGAYCIKPNKKEFETYLGKVSEDNLINFAKENNHEVVIVTLGSEGVIYYYDGEVLTIPAVSNYVADVTGAGDCFLAAFIYALTKGMSIHEAVDRANHAAAISVSHLGTYTLNKDDVIKTKVFTNGCFDILHRGHFELLEKSKAFGDYLIVGLNSDSSVRRLKGSSRPINSQEDRKKALESIKFVDEVVIFDEDTPYNLILQLKPDIITKGSDYTISDVVGNDLATVKIIRLTQGYSTTKVLEKL